MLSACRGLLLLPLLLVLTWLVLILSSLSLLQLLLLQPLVFLGLVEVMLEFLLVPLLLLLLPLLLFLLLLLGRELMVLEGVRVCPATCPVAVPFLQLMLFGRAPQDLEGALLAGGCGRDK